MTAIIIQLPRTPYGLIELICAKAKGLDLAGVDWDAAGARAYADWLDQQAKERTRRKTTKASRTDPPDDAA